MEAVFTVASLTFMNHQVFNVNVMAKRCDLCQVQVFKVLRRVCDSLLSQLGSSLGQDEEFLQLAAAEDCMQAAISWRVSYKRCSLKQSTSMCPDKICIMA